jgi:hypothetical protein
VVDFRYDGRPRRWFKALDASADAPALVRQELHALYGNRAQLVEVRPATADEEGQYLRGDVPVNVYCPTGRGSAGT